MKHYTGRLFINDNPTRFTFNNKSVILAKPKLDVQRYIQVTIPSKYKPGNTRWDNDMIDGVLDNIGGIDWKDVTEYEY